MYIIVHIMKSAIISNFKVNVFVNNGKKVHKLHSAKSKTIEFRYKDKLLFN